MDQNNSDSAPVPDVTAVNADELALALAAMDFDGDITQGSQKALLSSLAFTKSDANISVPFDQIHVMPGLNTRIENTRLEAHIAWLTNSIVENGYYINEPISCHVAMIDGTNRLVVNDGHCRLRALKRAAERGADIETVPVVIKPEPTMEELTIAFITTQGGLKLSPIELAINCKRLRNYNRPVDYIAMKLGFTSEYVEKLLTLASSPRSVRAMVEQGQVSAALAIDTLAKHGEEATTVMTKALETAVSVGKTRVTAKMMPTNIRVKALKKTAPKMFAAIERISKHSAFESLDDELKQLVQDILKAVPETEQAADATDAEGGTEGASANTDGAST